MSNLLVRGARRHIFNLYCLAKIFVIPHYYRLTGRRPIHFLHIGKTGGTAVEETLRTIPTTIIFHCHRTTLRDIPAGDKVAFIVRDPISRFVSGFYSRKRQGQPRYDVPWTREEKLAFGRFQTPNDLAIALSSKDSQTKDLAVEAMQTIGHVSTHYRDWLISADYLLSRKSDIIFIGRQETLEQDFEILKRILGITAVSLIADPVRSHRNPHQDTRLEPEAIENLREWYREDYRLLDVILPLRDEIFTAISRPL